jgi:DNA-binding YbaB/EbfC family protein
VNINPFELLKNAQHLQEHMGSFQEKLGDIVETGSAGGGMVEIKLNGKMEVLSIRIKPEVVDPEDPAMLEDLIAAAFGQAMEKMKDRLKKEIGSMAGSLGISGLPGLFGA